MALQSENSTAARPVASIVRWVCTIMIFGAAATLVFLDHRAEQTALVVGIGMLVAFAVLLANEFAVLIWRPDGSRPFLTFGWWHNIVLGLGFPLWHYCIAVRAFGALMSVDIVREIMAVYLMAWLAVVVLLTFFHFAGPSLSRATGGSIRGHRVLRVAAVIVPIGALIAVFSQLELTPALIVGGILVGLVVALIIAHWLSKGRVDWLHRAYDWAFPQGPTLMDWYVMLMKLVGHLTLATVFFLGAYRPFMPTGWRLDALRNIARISTGAFAVISVSAIFLILYLFLKRHFTWVVALRFVIRRRLSYMAMATVALGVFVLMVVTAIMGGFKEELRGRVRGSLSHIFLYIPTPTEDGLLRAYRLSGNTDDALGSLDYHMVGDLIRAQTPPPYAGTDLEIRHWMLSELEAHGIEMPIGQPLHETVRQALVKIYGLDPNDHFDWVVKQALRRRFDLPIPVPDDLTRYQVMMQARAVRAGAPDFADAVTPEKLMSALRRQFLRDRVAEQRAIVLKLNDPEYRAQLRTQIETAMNARGPADSPVAVMNPYVRQTLQRALACLDAIDSSETDVIAGAAGRVRTMALIVKKNQRELDYCQLYGIDPVHDLTISDMGVYLEQALYKEMHERLVDALNDARTIAAIEFADPDFPISQSPMTMPLDDINPEGLTETGRQLFEQLRISASLVSKVPPRDPGPEMPLREKELLRECRVKLADILDNQRKFALEKIIAAENLATPAEADEWVRANETKLLARDVRAIDRFRDLAITGITPLESFLVNMLRDTRGAPTGIIDDFQMIGLEQTFQSTRSPVPLTLLPDAGDHAVLPRFRAVIDSAVATVQTADSYAARLTATLDAAKQVREMLDAYIATEWPKLRAALASGSIRANDVWARLKDRQPVRLSETDLADIDRKLATLQAWLGSDMESPAESFWTVRGVYSCLDRLIQVDLDVVREMLLDRVMGTGPFRGVKFEFRASTITVARIDPSRATDAARFFEIGDQLVSIDGHYLRDFGAMKRVLADIAIGADMAVVVARGGAIMPAITVPKEIPYDAGVHQIIPFERFAEYRPKSRYAIGGGEQPQSRPGEENDTGNGNPDGNGPQDSAPTGEADFPPMLVGDRLAEAYAGYGSAMRPSYHSRLHLATAVSVESGERGSDDFQAREQGFHVAGLFHSRLYEDDRRRVYLTFDDALGFLDGAQTKILVGVKLAGNRYEDTESYKAIVAAAVAFESQGMGLLNIRAVLRDIATWEEERANLLRAVDREEMLLTLVLSMIILYAGIMIIIIIYLMVKEKTKDIGILKALGGSPDGIQSIFLFNGLFIGVFGALLGLLAGLVVILRSNWIEDTIERIFGFRIFPPDVYYLTYIPMKVDPWTWVAICVPTILLSFLFALYPANRAAKLDPVQALQYE